VVAGIEKAASAARAWLRVSTQVGELPAQAPVQPSKAEPPAGVAVRVIVVPGVKLALQVPGQAMPAGRLEWVRTFRGGARRLAARRPLQRKPGVAERSGRAGRGLEEKAVGQKSGICAMPKRWRWYRSPPLKLDGIRIYRLFQINLNLAPFC
jgi:hypothetical protein